MPAWPGPSGGARGVRGNPGIEATGKIELAAVAVPPAVVDRQCRQPRRQPLPVLPDQRDIGDRAHLPAFHHRPVAPGRLHDERFLAVGDEEEVVGRRPRAGLGALAVAGDEIGEHVEGGQRGVAAFEGEACEIGAGQAAADRRQPAVPAGDADRDVVFVDAVREAPAVVRLEAEHTVGLPGLRQAHVGDADVFIGRMRSTADAVQTLPLGGAAIAIRGEEGASADRGLPQGHHQIARHDGILYSLPVDPCPPNERGEERVPCLAFGCGIERTPSGLALPSLEHFANPKARVQRKHFSLMGTDYADFTEWTNEPLRRPRKADNPASRLLTLPTKSFRLDDWIVHPGRFPVPGHSYLAAKRHT